MSDDAATLESLTEFKASLTSELDTLWLMLVTVAEYLREN
jgi:hypothetical protein